MTVRLSQHLAVLARPPCAFCLHKCIREDSLGQSPPPSHPCDIPELHWAEWCPQQARGLLQLREFEIKSCSLWVSSLSGWMPGCLAWFCQHLDRGRDNLI